MSGPAAVKRLLLTTVLASSGLVVGHAGVASAAAHEPTCSTTLGITVHGQHIVGDYVTGIGHMELAWPPPAGVVGSAVADNGGVVVRGGPGPGFHFPNGFAPGASFCTGSRSPGLHL
jgi:hypothetical protein